MEAALIRVEADVAGGLPRFTIVGLPDGAVREAAERVRAAVKRGGFEWPAGRITVNLAPASLRKAGAGLDLAIAVALLGASGAIPPRRLAGTALLGELSLSGDVRPVFGALAVALAVAGNGTTRLITAAGCAREAALVPTLKVFPVATLTAAVELLRGEGEEPAPVHCEAVELLSRGGHAGGPDLTDVRGQGQARRALEVAAAGGHNLLLYGPPGSGKTMLARRLPGLLPSPSLDEALAITRVASCIGRGSSAGLVVRRPFRAPHHTLTPAALVGGGVPPRPGEISLAHGGVLFLDELPEFGRRVLDLLRQPLEERAVVLNRAGRTAVFPAHFLMVAAMNPCACGYLGDPVRECLCTPHAVVRYRGRISGPLLDRIDLHVEVPRPTPTELHDSSASESSAVVRARVEEVRACAVARYAEVKATVTGGLEGAEARRLCRPTDAGHRLLMQAMTRLALSARAHDAILKVAQTLADLEGLSHAGTSQVAEAVAFRGLDRLPVTEV